MEDINAIITNNFNDNIQYIQQHHKELFSKLSEYDAAVSNGHYKERYELVYENGNFDVFEPSTQKYLYDKKLNQHTKISIKSINYNLDNNTFESFFQQTFDQETLNKLKQIKKNTPLKAYRSYIAPITTYIQKTTKNRTTLHSIDKYIFFGIGLGLHITAIHKKIVAKSYLIIEDDLELFRLSLFTTNYAKIAQNAKLFFSIFEDDTEFSHTSNLFLSYKYYLNHTIKYFQLLSHSEDKANKFYVSLFNQPDLRFLFNDYMKIILKPLEYFAQHYKVLQKDLRFNTLSTHNIPFLIIASGPSLQNNIQWLKKNAQNAIIIAVSSSLKFLYLHNIKPNIVLHLDPFDPSIKSFHTFESNPDFFQNTLFFMAASSPSNVMNLLPKDRTYIYESGTSYQKSALSISAPCVGSLAYELLLVLKAKEIYLLGLDLAVDQITGKDHTEIHQDTKQLTLKNELDNDNLFSYKESLFQITGNFQEKVFTTPHFYGSIDIINRYFFKLQQIDQRIYNLSQGAYFKGTQAKKVKDISFAHLNNTYKTDIQQLCREHSLNTFNKEDIQKLKTKLIDAKKRKKQLNEYKISRQPTAMEYAQEIYDMFVTEEDLNFYELTRVLDSYLYYILHYVYDFLNDANITKKDYEVLHTIFKKELLSLIDYYIDNIEITLKELQCEA
jgi:hypothetical protein